MSKIRSTKAGYLYFDFYYLDKRCREYTGLENTRKNTVLMNETLKRIDSEISLGLFDYKRYFPTSANALEFSNNLKKISGPTFEVYTNTWFQNSKIAWKPSFKRSVRSILDRHLIPWFKDKPVAEITKWMIKEFRTELAQLDGRKGNKIKNKTINNIIDVFSMAMSEAAEEYEFENPFLNLKRLKVRKPDILPLSVDEVFTFLNFVPEKYRDYYIVRLFTGMRTEEVDGIQWKYVDFSAKKIHVRETWENRQWVSPKTETSVRDIDMAKNVEEALLRQKEITGDGELVFRTKSGRPFDHDDVTKRIWYPTLIKAGLAPRAPYQSRHTAASMWLASGENPEWVARQLGHANTATLFNVYSKFIPNLTRRDGSAFEKFIDGKLEENEKNNDKESEIRYPSSMTQTNDQVSSSTGRSSHDGIMLIRRSLSPRK
jgi:integrase